jgi:FSR family fosmidomycin resistance protein-like MFS transporter
MLTRQGLSLAASATSVATYLFASGVGGFFGGAAADRFGPRRVIALSLVLAAPFLFAAPALRGWPFLIAVAIGGFFLLSMVPVAAAALALPLPARARVGAPSRPAELGVPEP